ncbi:hypothetical protein CMUST_01135 [Corynebacterium mustelae]|uniref:Uncharacterized protein n=1 Tax=Corynebacterium mustelae TaxID=571915 RepID=A0A0G3H0E7_9CORY|nr:hypothetical protein [Corynebacterium mustelae]AKK04577.1 hypothetical protein CMUST_01135 [Corynebacterium mustelae]
MCETCEKSAQFLDSARNDWASVFGNEEVVIASFAPDIGRPIIAWNNSDLRQVAVNLRKFAAGLLDFADAFDDSVPREIVEQ